MRTVSIIVASLLAASTAEAVLLPYTNPGAVNLFRRVDQAGNLSAITSSGGDGYFAFDGGHQPWRLNSHGSSEFVRIVLPEEAVWINKIDIFWRGGFFGTDYTLRSSSVVLGSPATFLTVNANALTNPIHTFAPRSVRTFELNVNGFSHPNFHILHELAAFGTGPVYQRTGYNMLAEPGKLATITSSMSSGVVDPVGNAGDDNLNTFVRGTNTAALNDNNFFVLPLQSSAELMAISLGMYEDQPWTDVQVYLSNDATYSYDGVSWPGMTWNQVYDFNELSGDFRGSHFNFAPQLAKFVRVDFPADFRAGSALVEVQLFETYVPEPSAAGLALLGSVIAIRRSRRA